MYVKDRFFVRDQLQNHANEGKGKEKKKERGGRKEEKRKTAMVALLVFIMATLEIWPKKKKLGDEKVHLTLTFSKIRLEMLRWNTVIAKRIFFYEYQIVTPCFSTSN